MLFKSYKHFHELQMYALTDSHRDNSAHLRVVEFVFHCATHQDVIKTHLLLLKHKQISKQTNIKILTAKIV